MTFDECTPGRLICTPRGEILEVRHVKWNRMKAKVVYPPQKHITYREYGADMVALMDIPKESLLRKYEETLTKKPRH